MRPGACPNRRYALLARAADRWPDRTAVAVLPDAAPLARAAAPYLRRTAGGRPPVREPPARSRGAAGRRGRPDGPQLRRADHRDAGRAARRGRGTPGRGPVAATPRRTAAALRRPGARHGRARARAGHLGHRARSPADGLLDAILVLRPTGAADTPSSRLPESTACASATSASSPPSRDPAGFAGSPPIGSDLAALFHTGGTTGAPKLAAHTHANEVADAWMLAAQLAVRRRDRGLRGPAAVPRERAGGHPAGAALQGPAGGVGRAARLPRPRAVRPVLEDRRALPDRRDERRAHGVRHACAGRRSTPTSAACGCRWWAPRRCPPRSGTAFQAHTGVTLLEGYGLTEATCASARSFPDAPRPGSVGQRLPYQRVRRRVAADGHLGGRARRERRACWRSAARPCSPATSPAATRTATSWTAWASWSTAGWTPATSPASTRDGFVYLAGRAKDLIIRGGHNIDPADHRGRAADPPAGHRGRAPSAGPTSTPARYRSPTSPSRPAPRSPRTSCAPGRASGSPTAPPRPRPSRSSTTLPGHRGGQAVQAGAARGRHPQRRRRRARPDRPARRTTRPRSTTAPSSATVNVHRRHRHPAEAAVVNQYALAGALTAGHRQRPSPSEHLSDNP